MIMVIVVTALRDRNVVHDRANQVICHGFQAAHSMSNRFFAGVLCIRYKQNSIPLSGDYGGVGDHAYGGCIDQDIIELTSEACEEFRKAMCAQEFGRVGRYVTYRNHLKSLYWFCPDLLQLALTY